MQDIIYHYTSADGIYSILKNKSFWFSDSQYLNDKGEIIHIKESFKEALDMLGTEYNGQFKKVDVEFLINIFLPAPYRMDKYKFGQPSPQNNSHRYYVLCTSENADASNMWNYYVKNGVYQGYNLGINRRTFSQSLQKNLNNNMTLFEGEMIYKDQAKTIFDEMKKHIDNFNNNPKNEFLSKELNANETEATYILAEKLGSNFWKYINERKLFFKNHAFESEKEYRFILEVSDAFTTKKDDKDKYNGLSLEYRVGASGIITPYIEWCFGSDTKARILKEITLAPMIEADLAEESFKRFLDATAQNNIEIKQSTIKLRF